MADYDGGKNILETNRLPVNSIQVDENGDPFTGENPVPVDTTNKSGKENTSSNQEQLLSGILKELKIMNLHLMVLTDNVIDKTEVE